MDTPTPTPDGLALAELAKGGSDLSKLHNIDFTLRFPTQKAAESAEFQLLQLAFVRTKIERGKSESEWILQGSKRMYPVEFDLIGLRDKLNVVAAGQRGTYVGWRARVAE